MGIVNQCEDIERTNLFPEHPTCLGDLLGRHVHQVGRVHIREDGTTFLYNIEMIEWSIETGEILRDDTGTYQLQTEHDMGMHEGAEHRDCEDCR